MASIVLKDAHLTVNSVDLSDHVTQISFELTADTPEDTAMGDASRSYLVGLKDSTVSVTFNADYAASEVDATLWAIYSGGAAVTLFGNPDSSTTSTSNPRYTVSAILSSWGPLDGSVGDVAQVSASFQGTGDVTRATS